MTIGELVEILKQFDPKTEVKLWKYNGANDVELIDGKIISVSHEAYVDLKPQFDFNLVQDKNSKKKYLCIKHFYNFNENDEEGHEVVLTRMAPIKEKGNFNAQKVILRNIQGII